MDLLPGFAQGITRVIISYPFDVIKVKMQKNKTTTYDCFKKYIKNDRKIFFRGIGIPLITVSIERSISFKLYEKMNKKINPYVSGLLTSIVFSPINVPMQYLTNNIIHYEKKKYGQFIINEFKSKKIFNGYISEVSRCMIGSTLYLGTYGNIRKYVPNNNIGFSISGIIASLSSWIVIFPLDTIRTDFQTSKIKCNYKNLIYYRYNKYGILSFWRGITPIFMRSIPSSAIGMIVYENVKKYTDKY